MLLCFLPATALGQDQPDPISTARWHVGPLAVTPTIGLSNIGVDTNIFNQAVRPKSDFTATVSPQAQFWMGLGKGRLSGRARFDYVYFQQYATERAWNTYDDVRLELPLARLTPYATGTFLSARERPGYEIDARAQHQEGALTLGTDWRVSAKTTLEFAAWRTHINFDADEVFSGTYLSEVLNRTVNGVRASVRHKLTPLTTFVLDTEAQRDRFEFSPVRDSDSVRIMPGLDLGAFALISGKARVGYRKFDALGPGAPSFEGAVAAVELGYTLLGVTHFTFRTERDVAYSFEIAEPYYLLTGVGGTVTQKVSVRWDVQATVSRYRLDYRQVEGQGLDTGRKDHIGIVGAGLGYSLGPSTRLGLNLDRYHRTSDRMLRGYSGLRLGSSVTYGF
jgi:Putative beta-barrel porin 2